MFKKVFMEMGRSPSTCSSLLIADRAKSAHSLTSRLLSSSSVSYSHSSMTDMATISSSMIHESARTLHSQVPSTWSVAKRIQLNRGMRGSKCVLSAHVAFIAHGNGITVSLLSYNIQSFPWVKNRGQRVMRRISAKINTRTLHFTYFPYLSAPASNRPSTSLLPQHEYCHADFSKKSMCGESSSIFPTSLPKLCDNSNRTVPKECCQHSVQSLFQPSTKSLPLLRLAAPWILEVPLSQTSCSLTQPPHPLPMTASTSSVPYQPLLQLELRGVIH